MGPVDRSAFIAIPNIPSNSPRRNWRCGGIPLKETFRSARAGLAAGDRYSPDFDHQLARIRPQIRSERPPLRAVMGPWRVGNSAPLPTPAGNEERYARSSPAIRCTGGLSVFPDVTVSVPAVVSRCFLVSPQHRPWTDSRGDCISKKRVDITSREHCLGPLFPT